MPPNSPACARPTLSTTPTSGSRHARRAGRSRRCRSRPSRRRGTACRASSSSIVIGAPTSLLNEARGATVGPSRSRIARSRFFVVVLPFDPVTPTILRSPRARTRATTSVARAPSATTASSTTICGTGRSSGVLDDQQRGAGLDGRPARRGARRRTRRAWRRRRRPADQSASRSSTRAVDDGLAASASVPRRCRRAAEHRGDLGEGRARSCAQPASRSAARVVACRIRDLHARDLVVVLVAGAGVEDRVALAGERQRRADRGSRGSATS